MSYELSRIQAKDLKVIKRTHPGVEVILEAILIELQDLWNKINEIEAKLKG